MAPFDDLNHNLAPRKSIFDNQRIKYPNVYKYCGRTSFSLGCICMVMEMLVFILKRGFLSWGIGIWTGVPFVISGAVTMAVPKTMTVCAVNTCVVFTFCCCLLALLSMAASGMLISITVQMLSSGILAPADTADKDATPINCVYCGYFIIGKEVIQILMAFIEGCCAILLFCYTCTDCLCCTSTETEVILAPLTSTVTENTNAVGSPASSIRHSQSTFKNHCSTAALPGSSSAASVHRNYVINTASPMVYEL